jgi:hypothetical protein
LNDALAAAVRGVLAADSSFTTIRDAQSGHSTRSASERTNCSNTRPHFPQRYSKIGTR